VATADRHQPSQLVGGRRLCLRDRRADTARGVRRAGHAGGELLGAIAGEHEMRVTVHEPWDHAAPTGVDALIGIGPGLRDRDDPLAFDHGGGVAHETQRTVAELRVARHEQADVVDRRRTQRSTPPVALTSSLGTSIVAWWPSRTTILPPTTTSRTSCAAPA